MKIRFIVLIGFILSAIILFFLLRVIFGIFYSHIVPNDLLNSVVYSVYMIAIFFGLFCLFLLAGSYLGLKKTRNNIELTKGFSYSFKLSIVLFGGYIIFLIVSFILKW